MTVECKERGEILAKLRERYANLLSRVPREIKSLHEEVIAQRALDRRLTAELMQFKNTIGILTEYDDLFICFSIILLRIYLLIILIYLFLAN